MNQNITKIHKLDSTEYAEQTAEHRVANIPLDVGLFHRDLVHPVIGNLIAMLNMGTYIPINVTPPNHLRNLVLFQPSIQIYKYRRTLKNLDDDMDFLYKPILEIPGDEYQVEFSMENRMRRARTQSIGHGHLTRVVFDNTYVTVHFFFVKKRVNSKAASGALMQVSEIQTGMLLFCDICDRIESYTPLSPYFRKMGYWNEDVHFAKPTVVCAMDNKNTLFLYCEKCHLSTFTSVPTCQYGFVPSIDEKLQVHDATKPRHFNNLARASDTETLFPVTLNQEHNITVIDAPMGFGKSYLIKQHLTRSLHNVGQVMRGRLKVLSIGFRTALCKLASMCNPKSR